MVRTLLYMMAACAFLTWMGYIHWEANIVAFVAFQIGWMCDLPEEERRWLKRQRDNTQEPPGLN